MRLILGLTSCTDAVNYKAVLALDYIDNLTSLGMCPIIMSSDVSLIDDYLRLTDGIVLTGGGDIYPQASNAESASDIDFSRDIFELELCRRAYNVGIPILGICRGIQVINVAFGGTLIGEIHGHSSGIMHELEIQRDSQLHSLLGYRAIVNSYHKQAIDRLAHGFNITARAKDGTIEAIERENIIGVQWHPERMNESYNLFKYYKVICALAKLEK